MFIGASMQKILALAKGVTLFAGLLLWPATAIAADLEAGLAISDPDILERLEKKGLALDALLKSGWQRGVTVTPANNAGLSSISQMQDVFRVVEREMTLTKRANPGAGVGMAFNHKRLFDTSFLSAADARFPLVGIVQRLDRMYRQPANCGEVRLIYRLEYVRQTGDGIARSRLPMTLNLVLHSKLPHQAMSCRDLARKWIASGESALRGSAAVDFLLGTNGPLHTVTPAHIDRIETNFQSLRRPAASISEFGGHAEYVLKVFNSIPAAPGSANAKPVFRETAMENMIDRDRLLANPTLLARFKTWLFEPATVRALDDGTIDIPHDFRAINGRSFAPGGHARSGNRTSYGLLSDAELAAAITSANETGGRLKNISSPDGFRMRLDDTGCVGCHQSRAIGGFHFMGIDSAASKRHLPENAIFVPASAHFYGDAPRRRKILEALATGNEPDWARGFSLRPRRSMATERTTSPRFSIIGTGFLNGWGATCYTNRANDPSFKAWTCASGLACVMPHDTPKQPGLGVCMTKGRFGTGDAAEYGVIQSSRFGQDSYTRLKPAPGKPLTPPNLAIDSDRQRAAPQAGGFFGGMVYQKTCQGRFPASSICARHAGRDFNRCLATAANFKTCFTDRHTDRVGLRECDSAKPCRDDYICVATADRTSGACLPPYFMMQFRVDGHP